MILSVELGEVVREDQVSILGEALKRSVWARLCRLYGVEVVPERPSHPLEKKSDSEREKFFSSQFMEAEDDARAGYKAFLMELSSWERLSKVHSEQYRLAVDHFERFCVAVGCER